MEPSQRVHLSITCWHEAGHLVVALYEGFEVTGARVSTRMPGNGAVACRRPGPTAINPALGRGNARLAWQESLERTRSRMRLALAGPLAEARVLGTPMRSLGATSDFRAAFQLAQRLRCLWEDFGAWHGAPAPVPLDLLNQERKRVRRWLGRPDRWSLVTACARALERHGQLDRPAIWALWEEHIAPPGQASFPWATEPPRPRGIPCSGRKGQRRLATATPAVA